MESEDELRLYLDKKLFKSSDFLDFKKTSVYLADYLDMPCGGYGI
jgi:hypothetical protein